jgi:hypothetical protein
MVPQVVQVRAGDDRGAALLSEGAEDVEELGLAPVTTIGVVAGVLVAPDLVSGDDDMVEAQTSRQIGCAEQLAAGERRRYGGDGKAVVAERPLCDRREKRGVHASRVGDDDSLERPQDGVQLRPLASESRFHRAHLASRQGVRGPGAED